MKCMGALGAFFGRELLGALLLEILMRWMGIMCCNKCNGCDS